MRHETVIEDGTVYVATEEGYLPIADLDRIIDVVGGPAWTITYSEAEKQRYSRLDTADEGITVDVVDTINAMTFGDEFIETLRAQPVEPVTDDAVSPRLGLFAGRLLENLEYGVR